MKWCNQSNHHTGLWRTALWERPWTCKRACWPAIFKISKIWGAQEVGIHCDILYFWNITSWLIWSCRTWLSSLSVCKLCFPGLHYYIKIFKPVSIKWISLFLFILAHCVRVKNRLRPCRYRLFDQAWESAHSWKDKLAESCWPIATNQSHHRECLIVSMSSTPQPSWRFMKTQNKYVVVMFFFFFSPQ